LSILCGANGIDRVAIKFFVYAIRFPFVPVVNPHVFICTKPQCVVWRFNHAPKPQSFELWKGCPSPEFGDRIGVFGDIGPCRSDFRSEKE
jgi:hypothetical protein